MAFFPTKILLANDGTEDSAPAARAAADISEGTGSELRVIHVGKDISNSEDFNDTGSGEDSPAGRARQFLDNTVREVEQAGGSVAESHVIAGKDPADEVLKAMRDGDIGMVVVGNRSLGWFRSTVQGSVSSSLVRESSLPVLVVPSDLE